MSAQGALWLIYTGIFGLVTSNRVRVNCLTQKTASVAKETSVRIFFFINIYYFYHSFKLDSRKYILKQFDSETRNLRIRFCHLLLSFCDETGMKKSQFPADSIVIFCQSSVFFCQYDTFIQNKQHWIKSKHSVIQRATCIKGLYKNITRGPEGPEVLT